MRSSMRAQILVPFALLSVSAVAVTALVSAWAAARRGDEDRAAHLRTMVQTLGDARFPVTRAVLEKMRGLSGMEYVAVDAGGGVEAATLPLDAVALRLPLDVPPADEVLKLTDFPVMEVRGERYFTAKVPGKSALSEVSLYVLYPERTWRQDRLAAVWPPLVVGILAAVAALVLAAWVAHRFAERVRAVRTQLAQLGSRQYVELPLSGPQDELLELQTSANRLSKELARLENEVAHTERLRLLAQLAGGLAHQLRNAVTGARLAVQLHARRCGAPADESLEIALMQLSLTEEQIKGLLSLGARRAQEQAPGDLRAIVCEVEKLVQPMCRHSHVRLHASVELDDAAARVADATAVRAALTNLVLNAIEAAGSGGDVAIVAALREGQVELRVSDSGAGPSPELAQAIFEPFVTSKPEGVGLGLTLAQHAAAGCGGQLRFFREQDRTVFVMCWPRPFQAPKAEERAAQIALQGASPA